ncbi:MAG TPA: Hsp20/alpha crystallin family protein [Gemmatimonadaceae bacterium]|nr:Hsp20/alpha crystallin family protein [Gemmatimonadaceae bacterium]
MATRGTERNEERTNSRNAKTTTTNASTARGEQQRDLQTSRESGTARPSASSRADVERQRGSALPYYALASASPFSLVRRMMEDMDRLFSNFSSVPEHLDRTALQRGTQSAPQPFSTRNLWAPQVEVFERDNKIVVRADLPGLTRDNVDVEIEDETLIIRGERRNDLEDKREGYYRSERSYGSFYRAIPLPEGIDASAASASFKDGVLEVSLAKPKQQTSKAKKVEVK